MDMADDLAVEAKIHVRQAGYSAVAGAKQVGSTAAAGVREFGTEFLKQMLGHSGTTPPVSDDDLAKKQAADEEFSNNAYLQTVRAIYSEHRAKRQKEEQMRQQQEVQVKQEKTMDDLNQKRQMRADVATAVGKNSAETGRSWGAE